MNQEDVKSAAQSLAEKGAGGTSLVHYGATWNAGAEAAADTSHVAVLVCHGMGQQVRYETISAVAEAIRTEAVEKGGTVLPVEVHLSKENDAFLARAELNWRDKNQGKHCVHVYEAYWAPLTEGKVTYWDTIKFLVEAAGNCFKYSLPGYGGKFSRWMFGAPKILTVGRWGPLLLSGVLAILAVQGLIGIYVAAALARVSKLVIDAHLPLGMSVFDWCSWNAWRHDVVARSLGTGWHAVGGVLLSAVFIIVAYAFRYFVVEYVGDVAAYVSPYKDSQFDELRQKIQKVGLDAGKIIYGFGKPEATVPKYEKIIVVGHSLGSVLAYDTLNALINLDNVSAGGAQRDVIARTRALITFGSPLDKTAFIFRAQAKDDQDWIREQLAASVQPLIVSYELYRRPTFQWINIWSRMDIISGSLEYYDDPKVPPPDPAHVQNMIDPQARRPLLAHVQYWSNEMLREQLYKYVS